MSNPTSNFGWVMPTNTDLVTNLPADFAVFGQGVDTTMADLKGGTTGQILAKATNTDMDFTWIANDQGDITGITATSPLTGGGTSGAITVGIQASSTTQSGAVQLSDSTSTTSSVLAATPTAVKSAYDLAAAAVPKSTVTTAGDVIYATGSGAVTRLGIGTAGQVLTVNAGATAPSWATAAGGGGWTLLSTTTLSGTSTTVSSISGSYKNLVLMVKNGSNSTGDTLYYRFNGDTGNNYYYSGTRNDGGTQSIINTNANNWIGTIYQNNSGATNLMQSVTTLYRYTDTDVVYFESRCYSGITSGTARQLTNLNGIYDNSAAITSVTVTSASGNFSGTLYIYGAN